MATLVVVSVAGCGHTPRQASLVVFTGPDDPGRRESALAPVSAPPQDILRAEVVAQRLNPNAPKHLVLLTHGTDRSGKPDRWLTDCKDKIFARTGLADPELRVVIFDWAAWSAAGVRRHFLTGSDQTVRPYTMLAAYLAAQLLLDGGHLHGNPADQHIHLILHSRGAAIGGVLLRLLTEAGIPVDHVTWLDGLDTLHPHRHLELIGDPPLLPHRATWSDNYYCDGIWTGGVIDFDNYFVYGGCRATAHVNIHFQALRHVTSHDVYMATIDDPSLPWGWQWTALAGGYDPQRRIPGTWPMPVARLRVDGPPDELAQYAHDVWHTPHDANGPCGPRQRLVTITGGALGRFLPPGLYEVNSRRRGEPGAVGSVALHYQVWRGDFDSPSRCVSQCLVGDGPVRFRVTVNDLGVEHVITTRPNQTGVHPVTGRRQ